MKLRLIVPLAVVFGCVGSWCQTATNNVASQASGNIASNGSASPATAVNLPAAGNLGNLVELFSDPDRSSLSKLFSSSRQKSVTSTSECANNDCPVNQQCGTGCCTTADHAC